MSNLFWCQTILSGCKLMYGVPIQARIWKYDNIKSPDIRMSLLFLVKPCWYQISFVLCTSPRVTPICDLDPSGITWRYIQNTPRVIMMFNAFPCGNSFLCWFKIRWSLFWRFKPTKLSDNLVGHFEWYRVISEHVSYIMNQQTPSNDVMCWMLRNGTFKGRPSAATLLTKFSRACRQRLLKGWKKCIFFAKQVISP